MKIVVLTGAGISAESGIKTFRDHDGLWEGHDVMEVASPEGWRKNPQLVLNFYNLRRKQLLTTQPNAAHYAITELQEHFNVQVITQNVDNLHEKAGNKNVLHLHGELLKVRSENNPNFIYDWEKDVHIGDLAKDGSQLRPAIVWFNEMVPAISEAIDHVSECNIILVIGTSLQVYPAASLMDYAPMDAQRYLIDPNPAVQSTSKLKVFAEKAAKATPRLVKQLISTHA